MRHMFGALSLLDSHGWNGGTVVLAYRWKGLTNGIMVRRGAADIFRGGF